MKCLKNLAVSGILAATLGVCAWSTTAHADTTAFTITDSATLDAAVAQARADFLAAQSFDRLNATILVSDGDGTWSRGSYQQDVIQYPASCVKLPFLAAAMYWCRTNGHPYDYLDASVRPMIAVSDNVATGEVVDAITGAPNTNGKGRNAISFQDWYDKRLYTENYLAGRGLLGNQTILHKTYPTNSGSSPTNYEQQANDLRGPNQMNSRLSASLMLEVVKGAIEPGANSYMRELLTSGRFTGDSSIGFGVPPGSLYENKIGLAYDTLEDIAYIQLPNGEELILAVYTNGWDRNEPYPYDAAPLGIFAEMLIEELGLDAGNPPKIKIDNADAAASYTGAWTTGTAQPDKFGPSYAYATGGSGATATFDLNVPETGLYEVTLWWTDGSNRASNTPVTINHAGGATNTTVDQTSLGGCWVNLGDFNFNAGQGSVVIGTSGVASSSIVLADAVKITKWPSTSGGDTTPPAAPAGLSASASSGSVLLDWSNNGEGDFAGYNVYRSTTSGSGYTQVASNLGISLFEDLTVSNGTTYYYVVSAVDTSANESTYSSEVSATPQGGGGGTATSLHVDSITATTVSVGGGNKVGEATVTIVDDLGNPISGADVTATFTGSYNETVIASTNGSGIATITTNGTAKGNVSFTICIDDVNGSLTYLSGNNVETCDTN